jgi:cobalt-zinc-cadmium efflux system membrane fusion protein
MKGVLVVLAIALLASAATFAADPKRSASTVVLDETGVKNLRIETVEVHETDFEEIIFALGRIRVAPGHRAVISSRIPGRAIEVKAHVDTTIEKGADAVVLESRQLGDPPPRVTLTAPLTGLISAVKVVPGQPVTAEDSLIEIIDLREVHAVAAVPEHLAGKLRVGQAAHLRVAAAPERTFEATLAHLGAEADTGSGTLEAAFHVENPESLLRPGMRAEFSIVLSKRSGVMSVPREALQGDSVNRFVYVEDFDLPHAFVKSPVVIGQMNDRYVEITSGLLPGDKVVTRGAYSLAFAGGGSLSLKEALDAAHGHEHAADGSELKPQAQIKGGDHGHEHAEEAHASSLWKIVSGVLLVLLIISVLTKRRQPAPSAKVGEVQP